MIEDVPEGMYDISIHPYLCVACIANVPSPVPEEFTYLVCVPEDGVLYFYSGHYTFEAADQAAAMLNNAVVLKINLKGIIETEEEEGRCQDRET